MKPCKPWITYCTYKRYLVITSLQGRYGIGNSGRIFLLDGFSRFPMVCFFGIGRCWFQLRYWLRGRDLWGRSKITTQTLGIVIIVSKLMQTFSQFNVRAVVIFFQLARFFRWFCRCYQALFSPRIYFSFFMWLYFLGWEISRLCCFCICICICIFICICICMWVLDNHQ